MVEWTGSFTVLLHLPRKTGYGRKPAREELVGTLQLRAGGYLCCSDHGNDSTTGTFLPIVDLVLRKGMTRRVDLTAATGMVVTSPILTVRGGVGLSRTLMALNRVFRM